MNQTLDRMDLAHAISHDLSAPLRHINSYLNLLESTASVDLGDEARTYLERALTSAGILDTMIRELVGYLRTPCDEQDGIAELELRACLDAALARLLPSIRATDAEVEVHALPTVIGSRAQLSRLLLLLIDNAIKFRREGNVPRIQVSSARQGPFWLTSIRDNGIGIPEVALGRIFGIFRRAVGPSEGFGGTGIGLAACKLIVEGHGGTIWAESEVGLGSTFTFSLRAAAGRS